MSREQYYGLITSSGIRLLKLETIKTN